MKRKFFALTLCLLLATATVATSAPADSSQYGIAPCFIFDDVMEC